MDADPAALNVQNGILDLKTLELRDHDPVERHTRIAAASHEPERRPRSLRSAWSRRYPTRSFAVDPEGRRLLADRHSSEYLFIPHGDGANLKSTLEYAWRHALGDYA